MKAKITEVLNKLELNDSRPSKLETYQFLELMAAFNNEGIHFK